jgi:predicted small metal-binding protein
MAHQFTCDACGFQIRSEDDNELIGIVQTHADEKHDMSVSDADVRDGWEEARLEADD